MRVDLFAPPAIRQVDAARLQMRSPGQAPHCERSCERFREIPPVEHDRLKEDANPATLPDEPQGRVMLRDPARRPEAESYPGTPPRGHPMRGGRDMTCAPLLGFRVRTHRHFPHRPRVTVMLEDRVVNDGRAPAGLCTSLNRRGSPSLPNVVTTGERRVTLRTSVNDYEWPACQLLRVL